MVNKQVTLSDIAKKAGVSTNAVSKALRDCTDISKETKLKIKKIADELGYIPDITAKNLKKGNSNIIAIVFNSFQNPYFNIFNEKICNNLKQKNYQYHLIYCSTNLINMSDLESILINKFCGVISFVEPNVEVSDILKKRGIPFLLIGIKSNITNIDCLYTDDISGGKQVAQYFMNSEYQNALYITNSISETSYRRFFGFIEVLNNTNKKYGFIPYHQDDNIFKITCDKIEKEGIDFIFCFSDELAILLKNYIKRKNIKNKVMIIGYDRINKYHQIMPNISSVESDFDEMSVFACDYIIKKITGEIEFTEKLDKKFPTILYIAKS